MGHLQVDERCFVGLGERVEGCVGASAVGMLLASEPPVGFSDLGDRARPRKIQRGEPGMSRGLPRFRGRGRIGLARPIPLCCGSRGARSLDCHVRVEPQDRRARPLRFDDGFACSCMREVPIIDDPVRVGRRAREESLGRPPCSPEEARDVGASNRADRVEAVGGRVDVHGRSTTELIVSGPKPTRVLELPRRRFMSSFTTDRRVVSKRLCEGRGRQRSRAID